MEEGAPPTSLIRGQGPVCCRFVRLDVPDAEGMWTGKSGDAGGWQLDARCLAGLSPNALSHALYPWRLLHPVAPCILCPLQGSPHVTQEGLSARHREPGCPTAVLGLRWGASSSPQRGGEQASLSLAIKSPSGMPQPLHRRWQTVTIEEVGKLEWAIGGLPSGDGVGDRVQDSGYCSKRLF